MRAFLSLLYGLAAYAASMALLLYFVAFCGNLGVPRSIDAGGPVAAWPRAVVVDVLLLALFGVQHSVMARRGFKAAWTRLVPAAVERSTYIVASSAALAMLMACWRPIPAPVLWHVDGAVSSGLLWAGFWLSWAIVVLSTFLLDHFELFGLRQSASGVLRRAPARDDGLRTPLLYRHVRHPLYLGFLLTFWSVPAMTAGRLVFAGGMTAYILVGIRFEERDLVAAFGDTYRAYRQRVGMLLPRWRRPAGS